MKKVSFFKKEETENINALKGGSYSVLVTVIVFGILVAVNVLVSALPTTLTKFDISATRLFSITSNTKAVVNALDKDVTIYWIVQSGEEDEVIENLLGKYESLSDYIEVVKKNPDIYPTFAEQYTTETIYNNSLVVESGDKNRFISYEDIYLTETDTTTYSYTTSFDGEGVITSAIDYVVTEELPQLYVLEGHGELELSSSFTDEIEKANIETTTFSLLNVDGVPEEADAVLIYAPSTDISEEEKNLLEEYAGNGGQILVFAGPTENGTLKNLYTILSDAGIETAEGVVIEQNRDYYAFDAPYILLPDIESTELTDPLIEENYYAIMPIAQGLTVNNTYDTVTTLLSTSEEAFSKIAGYNLTTYEMEDGDIAGPFSLAVAIECYNDGQIIWFASSDFLDDTYNSYSSGANVEMAMNALASMVGENEAISIRSKSMDYNYLTISDSASSVLKMLMIGVFPLVYLGAGIVVILKRRRGNETH